ncbi:MAG: APC family permease [Candidatus Hodarchaeales archaeon]|jgi:amino acid transporter
MSESKTYVRDATGLVREIGVVTATIFILSNVIGGGWQQRVFVGAGKFPVKGAGAISPMVIAFILTGIGAILTVFLFAVMATAMPRAGGGYVYISRVISPGVGFVTAWAEFLGIAISYGLIATLVVQFAVIFFTFPAVGLTIFEVLDNPFMYGILGIVFTFLFAGIAYFGTSMVGKVLHIMFWIPAAITVVIYLVLFMGALDPTITGAGIEALSGNTVSQFINTALDAGLAGKEVDYFAGVSGLIPAAYWAWIGYAAISFAAGEVKEANKTLPRAHLAAGVIILCIYVSISVLMAMAGSVGNVQGWTLFDAVAFIDKGSHVEGAVIAESYKGYAWMPFIAMMTAEGLGLGVLKYFFAIAGVLWLANDLPPFVVTSSRILFAMSFDRSLPETFAKVDERWHSPTNAIIATAFVASLGALAEADFFSATGLGVLLGGTDIPILHTFMNSSGGIVVTDLLDAVFFTVACLAAIFVPTRLKDVYERAPWRPKIAGREAIVVIGVVGLIFNIYLDLYLLGALGVLNHIVTPAIPFVPPLIPNLGAGGMLDFSDLANWDFWATWVFLGFVVIGIVIYLVVKRYYSKRGVDFTTIYATIPPE